MAEQRQHKRIRRRILVQYGEGELTDRAFALDISVGGLFLICHKLPAIGTLLHLHVMEPSRDFYAEGVVVRHRSVPRQLRRIQDQGIGVRFLTPSELVLQTVPKADRVQRTNAVVCEEVSAIRDLLDKQIQSRLIVVPAALPAPGAGEVVEFTIEIKTGAGGVVEGSGRVVQIIGGPDRQQAVLEIQDAAAIRTALEAFVG